MLSPGSSATFREAAWAKSLLSPTMKVSNVYFGLIEGYRFLLTSIILVCFTSFQESNSEREIKSKV